MCLSKFPFLNDNGVNEIGVSLFYDPKSVFTNKDIVDIAERLQDVGIAALTIHGRLRTTKYSEPADWTLIGAVKNKPR